MQNRKENQNQENQNQTSQKPEQQFKPMRACPACGLMSFPKPKQPNSANKVKDNSVSDQESHKAPQPK